MKDETIDESVKERFWSKVNIGEIADCWEWAAGKYSSGYGMFWMDGSNHGAHRVAWELTFHETLGKFDFVCHKCDNPCCVNPSHLFKGGPRDNMVDKVLKGRQNQKGKLNPGTSGQKNHNAKLTTENVQKIRAEYSRGKTGNGIRLLANKYGVRPFTIYCIVNQKTWREI